MSISELVDGASNGGQLDFYIDDVVDKKIEPLKTQQHVLARSMRNYLQAPELHSEVHKQGGFAQQAALGPGPSTSTSAKVGKAKKSSDLKYDIFGWVILVVAIVAWTGFAKSNIPSPPPR